VIEHVVFELSLFNAIGPGVMVELDVLRGRGVTVGKAVKVTVVLWGSSGVFVAIGASSVQVAAAAFGVRLALRFKLCTKAKRGRE
jgi:hypothetical protein